MNELNQGHTLRRTIGPDSSGLTLVEYLLRRYQHIDDATWRGRIDRGEVRLDGQITEPTAVTHTGQVVTWAKPPWREPPAPLHFEVLFEDVDVLAVAKPSGLPTLPGAGFQEHTLLALVRAHAPGANPMHRLGRGTSGVVLFAKSAPAARAIQALWRAPGAVSKRYLALVSGRPAEDRFVVDAPIGLTPDPVLGELFSATPGGKASLSRFEVLARHEASSLAAVDIETGRPHQIRIHAAFAGHPLVGDPLYGTGGGRAPGSGARPGDLGYHLHAHRLVLQHPTKGGELRLVAPPPPSLER